MLTEYSPLPDYLRKLTHIFTTFRWVDAVITIFTDAVEAQDPLPMDYAVRLIFSGMHFRNHLPME